MDAALGYLVLIASAVLTGVFGRYFMDLPWRTGCCLGLLNMLMLIALVTFVQGVQSMLRGG